MVRRADLTAARYRVMPVEWRSTALPGEGNGNTLEGYAAVFGVPARIDSYEGLFDEVVARGAFKKTISETTPLLQFNHGRDARAGEVPIGAIQELREDNKGLFVRAELFDNDVVEPIRQAIAGGALTGMSFRFRVIRDEWDQRKRPPLRTIHEVQLFELGPVTSPAYRQTSVGVRSEQPSLDFATRKRHLDLIDARSRARR